MTVKNSITVDEIVLFMLQLRQLENVATHAQIKHQLNVSDYSIHTNTSIHALLQRKLQELASYNIVGIYMKTNANFTGVALLTGDRIE